jgi:transcription initiation factor TFIID subunit 6
VGIVGLSDVVASALSSDVEYRIHQVVDVRLHPLCSLVASTNSFQEAARFMRHARRTTLTTSDIEQALRVLNIEPLYGHSPHAPLTFRRVPVNTAGSAPVFFVEDEEIEFDRVLREDKISLPRPTRWTAHWLAVEGVQPLVPENPPAIPREGDAAPDASKGALGQVSGAVARTQNGIPTAVSGLGVNAGAQALGQGKTQQLQQQHLVKQVLSRELQLYYTRLTGSLLPSAADPAADGPKRIAALASLRHDAGLQALLPYLVRWVGEGVVAVLKTEEEAESENTGSTLEMYMDVISALLENTTLFVEPYVSAFPHSMVLLLIPEPSCTNSYLPSSRPSCMQGCLQKERRTSAYNRRRCSLVCSLNTQRHIPPLPRVS